MKLNKLDELKVREKATMPDLSQFIPNPLRDIQKMNGLDGYTQGYRQALLDIRKEINDKTAQGYKFPLLHIFDWIDRKLGLKE